MKWKGGGGRVHGNMKNTALKKIKKIKGGSNFTDRYLTWVIPLFCPQKHNAEAWMAWGPHTLKHEWKTAVHRHTSARIWSHPFVHGTGTERQKDKRDRKKETQPLMLSQTKTVTYLINVIVFDGTTFTIATAAHLLFTFLSLSAQIAGCQNGKPHQPGAVIAFHTPAAETTTAMKSCCQTQRVC